MRDVLLDIARKAATNTQSSLQDIFTRAKSQAYLFGATTKALPDADESEIRAEIESLRVSLSKDPEAGVALEKPSRPPVKGREPFHDPKWDDRLLALRKLIDVPMKTDELFAKAERELRWNKAFFQAAIAASEGRKILEYQPPHWMPAPKETRTVTKQQRVRTIKSTRQLECLIDGADQQKLLEKQKKVNSKRGFVISEINDKQREIRARHRQELLEALGPLRAEKNQLDKELQGIVDQLTTGTTFRDIECEERFDYETGVVCVVRLDTRDIVERRSMAGDERQLEIAQ